MSQPPIRILLVDDSENSFLILQEHLSNIPAISLKLTWVTTAATAQAALNKERYDLILMDYVLGSRQPTGVDIIRAFVANGLITPIVLLTADDDPAVDQAALAAGAVDFLTKSELTPQMLGRTIRYAIARYHIEATLRAERAALERRVAERTSDLSAANAELARAARLKDEFLANMSHELRTPLNAILGLTEALGEHIYGSITDRQHTALKQVVASSQHLLAVINDILDLARIGAGRVELDLGPVAIAALCQDSIQMIRYAADKKQLTVTSAVDPTMGVLAGDGRRLRQVLVNLLSNAVKFTPAGGAIGLEVSADTSRQRLQFTVWDTGIGIADKDQIRLFQPFVQLDSGLARQYEGSGLGLALVARITELHGGSVALQSNKDEGSRFTVTLPWHASPTDVDTGTDTVPADHAGYQTIRKALIIDDSRTATAVLSHYLHSLGIATVVHPRGAHALETVIQARPDVILLDILLPDSSGWDVLAQLKTNLHTRGIPVVIVSVEDDSARALALGAHAALVKPVTQSQLRQVLGMPEPHRSAVGESTSDTAVAQAPPQPLVLLAEDNEANIVFLCDYLQVKGYRVVVARNGIEATALAQEVAPDMILMDIHMPEIDGLEATRRIRADTALAHIPIIAVTALAMPGDRERCLAAGATAYLSKPISLKALVNLLDEQRASNVAA
jgi:signal transduction histidine kinase